VSSAKEKGDEEAAVTAGIRLLARLARVCERSCLESGISLPQYRLLVSISGQPQRACELAARVGVSRPTLTSLVDGLEQSDLLRRVRVPNDRRGIWLEPTEDGLDAITRAEHSLAERLSKLIDRESVITVGKVVAAMGDALDREGTAQTPARI
jgi:DNA-binding MarR family transcriptional regulator